jgi:hypothetical protein
VATFHPAGPGLTFSTYLGGSNFDGAFGVAVDGAANVYVTGVTAHSGFPFVRPLPALSPGWSSAFVSKITAEAGPTTTVTPGFGEPGGQITAGATGVEPGAVYVLALATSADRCSIGMRIGGGVVAASDGSIAPTARTIPTTVTPGTRYLCWMDAEDSTVGTPAVPITVF